MLLEMLKRLLTTAIKEKDEVRKGILRLVIADIEADYKRKGEDAWAESVTRKHIKQNGESLEFLTEGTDDYNRVTTQTALLNSLLPKTLTVEQIEDELLNTGDGELKAIKEARNDGQAMGIAMKHLKGKGLAVLGNDVKTAVANLRS